jgi:hypothetical protein
VTGDGEGLVSRGGLVWLAETADLRGLTAGFETAFAGLPGRLHVPGRTMAQMVLAFADGATALSDIVALRNQSASGANGRSHRGGHGPAGSTRSRDPMLRCVAQRLSSKD